MKQDSMKSTHMFRDQVNTITGCFKSWNECEQTVALYSLLKKISPTQAKFLLQVLQQSLTDVTEVQLLERDANSPAFINSLCNESKENAVSQLLAHLPLLRPGNMEAKAEYLKIIPKVLAHSIDYGIHIEESRQLLSYSLIHPAINSDERSQFTLWLGHLEERLTYNIYHQQSQRLSHGDAPPPAHASAGGSDLAQFMQTIDKTTGSTTNGTSTPSYSSGHQVAPPSSMRSVNNGWQQAGQRDSGISVNGPDSGAILHMLSGVGSGVPRAITAASSSSTLCNSNGNGLLHADHIPLHQTHSGPPSFSVPTSQGGQSSLHRKLTRSASVTPPINMPASNVSDWLNAHHELMERTSGRHLNNNNTEGHAPLSPQSSVTSSGSGSDPNHDDHSRNSFIEASSGMKDVPLWLKSLRLHKYAYLFQQMTYDDMMTLTEEWLESQNVTKGARHKIALSIAKLKERQNALRQMEKEILESCNLKQALVEIKNMMNTPMKRCSLPGNSANTPNTTSTTIDNNSQNTDVDNNKESSSNNTSSTTSNNTSPANVDSNDNKMTTPPLSPVTMEGDSITEGDLPGQLTRVLGKVCTQLMVTSRPEDECFAIYLQLLDKCMMHDGFSAKQKKLLASWKQQIQKIWHPPPQKYNLEKQRRAAFGNTFPLGSIGSIGGVARRPVRGQQIMNVLSPGLTPAQWTFSNLTNRPPTLTAPPASVTMPLYRNNSLNTAFSARPQGIFELKQQVQRTHSAPIKSSFGLSLSSRPASEVNATEPEINARLDSLCLSMTEHALGGFDFNFPFNTENPADRGSTF
jgi:hypothetical protein